MINSKHKRLISIIICFLVVVSLISLNRFKVRANEVSTKPTFKISNLAANPTKARVGEDILVTGQLDPQDFEKSIQPKEIVLILDTSKSMNDEITINGVKATKINQLKESAKEFVRKMEDVNNLKISIITYGSTATINKVNIAGNNVSLVPVTNNSNSLTTIIDNISANGGTNIGEGLRQAAYLLNNSTESNKEADKTIILMSDALPTYCTLKSKDPISYYLDTTKELGGTTWNSGSGANDVFGYDLNYAKEVGKLINDSKFKVFTVGYGLEAEGVDKFKQIHASMLGLTSDECNQENGFYSKSDGSIDEIFKKVGDKIIENYFLKESELDLNLTENFTLKIGGKNIKIRDIQYKNVSTNKDIRKTNKIIYHANPVNFSFIVRGGKVGDNQLVLDKIDINFLFENNRLSESHNVDLRVDIIDDELPHISAKLLSDRDLKINSDDEITLKYEVIPEDFEYIDYTNSGEKDVVFLLDISYKNNMLNEVKKELHDKVMNSNELKNTNTKYSIITFSDDSNILFDFNYYGGPDKDSYINSINKDYLNSITPKGIERNIGKALKSAEQILLTSRASASKNIVILSDKNVIYSEADYKNLRDKNYNILTLSFSENEKTSELYKLHNTLGGKEENIIYANNESSSINNTLMNLIKEKLVSFSVPKPYEFNTTINLNIGNNFEPVEGIVKSTEEGKSNMGLVEVPTITYKLMGNNTYKAQRQIVELKLKANNLNSGTYTFGNEGDNYISYKNLRDKLMKFSVDTPSVYVRPQIENLTHGLYNGINDGSVEIQENNGQSFAVAPRSTLTFGSSFTLKGSKVDLTLNIDNNLIVRDDEIKVYKLVRGELEEVKDAEVSNKGNNRYNILIKGFSGNTFGENLLIVYRGTVKEEEKQDMKNTITISNIFKDVNMSTTSSSNDSPRLPDLF